MLDNQTPMDKRLREKFESFEMIPPETVWEGIKMSLKTRGGMASWLYFVPAILFFTFFTIHASFGDNKIAYKNPNALKSENNLPFIDAQELTGKENLNPSTDTDKYSIESSIIELDSEKYSEKYSALSAMNHSNSTGKQKPRDIRFNGVAKSGMQSPGKVRASVPSNEPRSGSRSATTTTGTTPTPFVSRYLSDEEENRPYSSLLTLPKRELKAYYFINSANPTESAVSSVRPKKQMPSLFDRFSIDGGVGVSTFRITPTDKNSPELKSIVSQWNSGEIGFGAQLGINYAFRGNYGVSAGIEVISQKNKLVGEITETQTSQFIDTVGYDTDSLYNTQDSMWYVDTTWNVSIIETTTLSTSQINARNRSTMLIIPFSFSFRKSLGVRSSLEFNLGGSLGIYQEGSGQVVTNSSGQLVSLENAYRKKGQLMMNASVKYLYQISLKQALYVEPRIGIGTNNFYQSSFEYKSRISQLGIKVGYRVYL